ncbi:cyclin-dependent kinase 11B isoform X2 [Microplitis demolitor]|nr:cyclin-dependent kinase 11B isoform X2 [Microplitis demolitor]
MDIDNGRMRQSPMKDTEDFSFSEEEGGDTADSLDIKPPQAALRLRKSNSSRRRDKHGERRDRRDDKDRKSRHHDREDRRRENKHRHRRHGVESASDGGGGSKRDRDRLERTDRLDTHSRSAAASDRESSRYERKERITEDRVLEDLRSRLLDKRRERRDDSRDLRDFKSESRRELRLEETREPRDRREVRVEDTRDRRDEIRVEERRNVRSIDNSPYNESELVEERPNREKRHKRSHKPDRVRDKDREQNREREFREKQIPESMMEGIEDNREELNLNDSSVEMKDPKELMEQELRKERLLEADREFARRKEAARLELEERRSKRGEKRPRSPDPSIFRLSDESLSPVQSDDDQSKSSKSQDRHSSDDRQSVKDKSSDKQTSDSSDSSSDDDESTDSNKGTNDDSNDGSDDYSNPSPLSVDRLVKSDHSDGGSPGRVVSNGAAKEPEEVAEEIKDETEQELPPYLPAIQGCRYVDEFLSLNRIEEGTYGVVYRARDKRTGDIVALKKLKMDREKEGFPITSLREINTLLKAQHPNIVTVREIVVGSNMDKIYIVMDYVEHDLKSLMETMKQKKQNFLPSEVKCLMQQLLKAVAHLHDNWILHRDLKTSNLLLSHRGILKVGDFGLAREYGSPLGRYTQVVVTLWYRAPELLLNGKEYSTPIDMWSVGCIFAELIRMEALFPGKSEIDQIQKIFKELGSPNDRIWPGYSNLPLVSKIPFAQSYPVNNLHQRFRLKLSDNGMDLLCKMLTYDPAQRITAEDALQHPYFTESPLPIEPSMFPTWPAKSEQKDRSAVKTNASPKPPSGGKEYKQLGEYDEAEITSSVDGFHMGLMESGRRRAVPAGAGFHLKF